jgi:hypothetical protein
VHKHAPASRSEASSVRGHERAYAAPEKLQREVHMYNTQPSEPAAWPSAGEHLRQQSSREGSVRGVQGFGAVHSTQHVRGSGASRGPGALTDGGYSQEEAEMLAKYGGAAY